ncbi:MAG: hypothetical protein JWO66_2062 [Candidatus Eremiobacteraeota bacterium]|nr:hypothetical protein [Candidatus Eremiobacteraeota bacterium]
MTARIAALSVAGISIALVAAQDLYPFTPLYHTWQYALALALGLAVIVAYANAVRRGDDGVAGRRLLVALAGAALAVVGGLASGLLGPDTAGVIGTPGTVVPVPTLGAAAFFGPGDGETVARGASGVTLRRRNAGEIALAGSARRIVGESLIYLDQRTAAYVETFDDRGAHLTVTQPTNPSFLSPVLLFRQRQQIGAFDVPFDTFAVPARHRIVRALYFTPDQLARFGHQDASVDKTRPALILTVADDAGRSLGIMLAGSGQTVALGGIRVRATLGTYPALAVAAAPPTWALVAGIALFLGGIVWSVLPQRPRAEPGAPPFAEPGTVAEQS